MVGITFVHRKGYFHQTLDQEGNQAEEPAARNPEWVLGPMKLRFQWSSRAHQGTPGQGASLAVHRFVLNRFPPRGPCDDGPLWPQTQKEGINDQVQTDSVPY